MGRRRISWTILWVVRGFAVPDGPIQWMSFAIRSQHPSTVQSPRRYSRCYLQSLAPMEKQAA
eukprot:2594263-Alexandrium_andersonii.AAC.1